MAVIRGRTALEKFTERVEKAKEATKSRDQTWIELWDYYQGEGQRTAFDTENLPDWAQSEIRIANFVWSIGRTTFPILLDTAPTWFVVDEEAAPQEGITDYMQAYYHARKVRSELRRIYEDSWVLGTGMLKVWYDDDMEGGADVATTWQDPFCVFPDPAANKAKDCEYVAILNEYSEAQAKRIFPGGKNSPYAKINLDKAEHMRIDAATRPTRDDRPTVEDELVAIYEVYHDFGESLTIYSGTQVLYSGANPIGDHYPVVFFYVDPDARAMWGRSEVTQLIDIQDDINLERFRFNINAKINASPQKLVVGMPNIEVTNKPGEVYKAQTPEGDIRNIIGPDLPQDLWNMMTMNREALDVISGVHNVTRGRRPPGVQAGVAIQALQEAAQSRPREIARDFASSLEIVGQILLECMQANYDQGERVLPYSTGEGMKAGRVASDELTMLPSQANEPTGVGGKISRYIRGVAGERVARNLRVVVQTGGDLPLSQAQRADQSLRLWDTEAIDRPALLEALNFPDRQDIVARMDAKEQAMMQMQMMQQGQQGQQQAAPPEMSPEDAVALLQQALEPEDLVMLVEIRELMVAQGELTDEHEIFLEEIMQNPELAPAVQVFLMVEPEEETMQT